MGHHYLHLLLSTATHSDSEQRQVIDSDSMGQGLIQRRSMNLAGFSEVTLFVDSFRSLHPFRDSSNAKSLHALAVTHTQAIIRSDQIRRLSGF